MSEKEKLIEALDEMSDTVFAALCTLDDLIFNSDGAVENIKLVEVQKLLNQALDDYGMFEAFMLFHDAVESVLKRTIFPVTDRLDVDPDSVSKEDLIEAIRTIEQALIDKLAKEYF